MYKYMFRKFRLAPTDNIMQMIQWNKWSMFGAIRQSRLKCQYHPFLEIDRLLCMSVWNVPTSKRVMWYDRYWYRGDTDRSLPNWNVYFVPPLWQLNTREMYMYICSISCKTVRVIYWWCLCTWLRDSDEFWLSVLPQEKLISIRINLRLFKQARFLFLTMQIGSDLGLSFWVFCQI